MSSIYSSEPPSTGKVRISTTAGDIDIELWGQQTPLATRNFTQLAMEGYYDGCVFHRVVAGLCVQTGDPSGTGHGGESIYGAPFKTEVHSRLKFSKRGRVAMASSGTGGIQSQFFITLDELPHLDGKYSVFGRVVGNTIFNVLEIGALETVDDRPVHPPSILSIDILVNPFPDIQPRSIAPQITTIEKPQTKKKRKKKKLKLLSFEEDAEDATERDVVTIQSSHDVLCDERYSTASAYDDNDNYTFDQDTQPEVSVETIGDSAVDVQIEPPSTLDMIDESHVPVTSILVDVDTNADAPVDIQIEPPSTLDIKNASDTPIIPLSLEETPVVVHSGFMEDRKRMFAKYKSKKQSGTRKRKEDDTMRKLEMFKSSLKDTHVLEFPKRPQDFQPTLEDYSLYDPLTETSKKRKK